MDALLIRLQRALAGRSAHAAPRCLSSTTAPNPPSTRTPTARASQGAREPVAVLSPMVKLPGDRGPTGRVFAEGLTSAVASAGNRPRFAPDRQAPPSPWRTTSRAIASPHRRNYCNYMTRELKVTRIGNSRGVRLPAQTIRRYGIGASVVLEERSDGILLRPPGPAATKLSWEETARAMAASGEDWSAWNSTLADGLAEIPWKPRRTRQVAEPQARDRGGQRRGKRS